MHNDVLYEIKIGKIDIFFDAINYFRDRAKKHAIQISSKLIFNNYLQRKDWIHFLFKLKTNYYFSLIPSFSFSHSFSFQERFLEVTEKMRGILRCDISLEKKVLKKDSLFELQRFESYQEILFIVLKEIRMEVQIYCNIATTLTKYRNFGKKKIILDKNIERKTCTEVLK